MIKEKSYVTIQGWMTKLDIKGNALIAFACIYGFSQDGESEFKGSAQYIADWCGVSRTAAFGILNSLVGKGLVVKIDNVINGVRLCNYKANLEGIKKLDTPSQESLHGGYQETGLHIISSYPSENDSQQHEKKQRHKKELKYPTQEEVIKYVQDKNLVIDPCVFFNYYTKMDWQDAFGKKVQNWKGKAISWDTRERKTRGNSVQYSSIPLKENTSAIVAKKCPTCGSLLDQFNTCPKCHVEYDVTGRAI